MNTVLQFMKDRLRKAKERDRRAERHVEALSRLLWRWREPWLIVFVSVMAILDYLSTVITLELGHNDFLYETGALARWALEKDGLGLVFLVDMGAVIAISLAATAIRFFYLRLGFNGFARAVFVVLLLPYAVMAFAAIVNNLVLTFL